MEGSSSVRSVIFKGNTFSKPPIRVGLEAKVKASNSLGQEWEREAIEAFLLPSSTNMFILADANVGVDWICPGWFTIHEIAFRMGFKLPCSDFIKSVICGLNIAPYLIMPSVWRLLHTIEALCEKYRLKITVADLKNVYIARGIGRGRTVFRIREGRVPLVVGQEPLDEDWKAAWLFIEKKSMRIEFDWIPESWSARVNDWVENGSDAESQAHINAFMNIPLLERQGLSVPRPAICWGPTADAKSSKSIPITVLFSSDSQEVCRSRRVVSVMEKIRLSRKRELPSVPALESIGVKPSKAVVAGDSAKVYIDIPQRKRKVVGMPDLRSVKPFLDAGVVEQGSLFVKDHSDSLRETAKSLDVVGLVMHTVVEQHKKVLDLQSDLAKAKRDKEKQEHASKELEEALNKERQQNEDEYDRLSRNYEKIKKSLEELEIESFNIANFYNGVGRIQALSASAGTITLEKEYAHFTRMFPSMEVPELDVTTRDLSNFLKHLKEQAEVI